MEKEAPASRNLEARLTAEAALEAMTQDYAIAQESFQAEIQNSKNEVVAYFKDFRLTNLYSLQN